MTDVRTALYERRLRALDEGCYEAAVVELDAEPPSDDPAHRIWRASVLVYRGRLDAAREEIDGGRYGPLHRDRATLVLGEISLWEGAHELARDIGETVALRARVLRDRTEARALVARAAVRRGDYETGLAKLAEPLEDARALGMDYLAGVLLHSTCYSLVKLGRTAHAGQAFTRALSQLARTGNLRWEGMNRSLYGLFLADLRLFGQAREEHERALAIARESGVLCDELYAANNYAQLLLSEGEIERALHLLEPIARRAQGCAQGMCEALARFSIATGHALEGRREETRAAAETAAGLARILDNPELELSARIFAAWGRFKDDDLRALVAESDACGTDLHRFLSRTLLARETAYAEPLEAARLIEQAEQLPDADGGDATSVFLELARRRIARSPVRVEGDRFTVDLAAGWPDFRLAVATMARWLLSRALAAADGNKAAAGRLVGLRKRWEVCNAWNQAYEGRTRRRALRDAHEDGLEDPT